MTSERNQQLRRPAGCEAPGVTTPLAGAAGVRVKASQLVLGVLWGCERGGLESTILN